jgi:hypothetical protein
LCLLPCSFPPLTFAFRVGSAVPGHLTPRFLQVLKLIFACCTLLGPCCDPLSVRKVRCLLICVFSCRYLTCGYLQVQAWVKYVKNSDCFFAGFCVLQPHLAGRLCLQSGGSRGEGFPCRPTCEPGAEFAEARRSGGYGVPCCPTCICIVPRVHSRCIRGPRACSASLHPGAIGQILAGGQRTLGLVGALLSPI